jgi:serine protease Do
VVRRDPARDLAALQLDAVSQLVPADIRDSGTLAVGELVFAAGNPLGFVGAVTAGLVHRSSARWVVADVRLAPGNSGGPLADAQGRVVGINSMVAHGLALAVPTAEVAAFLETQAERRLGITYVKVGAREGGHRIEALLITGIEPGSVAERSGLVLGDAIVGTNDPRREAALDVVRDARRRKIALAWPEDARAA